MKPFISNNVIDSCWRDCLGCILEIEPRKIPNFVRLYGDDYMDASRKWLAEKLNKGLVYIPANQFMETDKMRHNAPIGPSGFSIGYMELETDHHAVVCFNGGLFWDNGDDRHEEYKHLKGYYVIYDLGKIHKKIKKASPKRRRVKKA